MAGKFIVLPLSSNNNYEAISFALVKSMEEKVVNRILKFKKNTLRTIEVLFKILKNPEICG